MKCLIGLPLLIHIELLWRSRGRSFKNRRAGVGSFKNRGVGFGIGVGAFVYRIHSPVENVRLHKPYCRYLCVEVEAAPTLLRTHAPIFLVARRSGLLISARPRDVPHTEMKLRCIRSYQLTSSFEAFRTKHACCLQGSFDKNAYLLLNCAVYLINDEKSITVWKLIVTQTVVKLSRCNELQRFVVIHRNPLLDRVMK
jgi:hypothetical protein